MTPSERWLHGRGKRAFDFVVGGFALAVTWPLSALVALAVRAGLGSPVLFRQRRAGQHDSPIEVVKFRTMTDERSADGALLPDAERLTRFGRLLRAASLDELPQLWSVVKGEMSLVGPRPLPTAYTDRYSPEQRRRLEAKPGITGFAQVSGRNALDWPERLAMDVWYVDNASLALDVRLLLRTARAVVTRGGISAEGHATMREFTGNSQPS